jgi:hypothetical protein
VFLRLWKGNMLRLDGRHGWQQLLVMQSRDGCHGVQILLRSWIKYDSFYYLTA